jgi:hypothetical protein
MAHKSFSYKGYDIWLAAKQLSKTQRGGKKVSLQVCKPHDKGRLIEKQFLFESNNVDSFSKATKKATDWIDEQLLNK